MRGISFLLMLLLCQAVAPQVDLIRHGRAVALNPDQQKRLTAAAAPLLDAERVRDIRAFSAAHDQWVAACAQVKSEVKASALATCELKSSTVREPVQ